VRWSGRPPAVQLAVVAGVTAAVCAGVGVATGAIPGSDGKISACYGRVGGLMRVIDVEKGERCSSTLERPLSWNMKGEPGPPGADASSAFSLPTSGADTNLRSLTLPAGIT